MHRAGDAGIEAVDGAQNLDGLFHVMQLVALQGCFIRPLIALRIARPGIPGVRHDGLIVVDLLAAMRSEDAMPDPRISSDAKDDFLLSCVILSGRDR